MKKSKPQIFTASSITKTVNEAMWSGSVVTKWHPPEGFFTKSASEIASGLKSSSDSLGQAMSRLDFYINRAGDNLSGKQKVELEKAKTILHSLYPKKI